MLLFAQTAKSKYTGEWLPEGTCCVSYVLREQWLILFFFFFFAEHATCIMINEKNLSVAIGCSRYLCKPKEHWFI